jgi:hypothetical protein
MIKQTYLQASILLALMFGWPQAGLADLIDPTRPPTADSTSMYDLSEIIISPERQFAVIGGHIFHIGDSYQGITVLEIAPNAVKIKRANNEVTTLNLFTSPLQPVVKNSVRQ